MFYFIFFLLSFLSPEHPYCDLLYLLGHFHFLFCPSLSYALCPAAILNPREPVLKIQLVLPFAGCLVLSDLFIRAELQLLGCVKHWQVMNGGLPGSLCPEDPHGDIWQPGSVPLGQWRKSVCAPSCHAPPRKGMTQSTGPAPPGGQEG